MYVVKKIAVVVALIVFAAGCQSDSEQSSQDGTEEGTEQEETRQLTFAFQPQENPEGLQLNTEEFEDFIGAETGYDVEVDVPTTYAAVVEALRSENADVAYFSGLPYLRAHQAAGAELLVVEERDGEPFYHSQWYVREDSDYEDLSELEDRDIAFTSPTSTSGFLFPMAKAIDEGLIEENGEPGSFFGEVRYAGGYQQALLALVNGQVEAAAASDYALEQYLTEEQRDQVRVLTRQGPVPTHGLAIRGDLPDEVKQSVEEALLKLNEPENQELLESVYGAERLVARDHDEHVAALEDAYEAVDFEDDF